MVLLQRIGFFLQFWQTTFERLRLHFFDQSVARFVFPRSVVKLRQRHLRVGELVLEHEVEGADRRRVGDGGGAVAVVRVRRDLAGQEHPEHADQLLDRAIGTLGLGERGRERLDARGRWASMAVSCHPHDALAVLQAEHEEVRRLVRAFEPMPPGWRLVLAGAANGYGAAQELAAVESSPRRACSLAPREGGQIDRRRAEASLGSEEAPLPASRRHANHRRRAADGG